MNMNIQNLMREAQKMQKNLQKTQEELVNTTYEGVSALVSITLNGNKDILSVKINSDGNLDKEDVEMLEDLILTCVNEALRKVDSAQAAQLGKYNIPGLM